MTAERARGIWVAALVCVTLVAVAAANGGFFATTYSWIALIAAWFVFIAAAFSTPGWPALDRAWLLAGAGLCLVMFASATWWSGTAASFDQGLRALGYVGFATGLLLVLRAGDYEWALFGSVAGVTMICAYSLATRLHPGHAAFSAAPEYRLFAPIGYWNALGIFAAVGSLLAFGIAATGRRHVLRVLSAAALTVLAPTLYYTYSRGAWAALVVGLVVALVFGPRRARTFVAAVVLLALPALGVWLASRPAALTHRTASFTSAANAGHLVARELAVVAVLQACAGVAWMTLADRVRVSRRIRTLVAAAALAAALAAAGVVVTTYASPTTLVHRAYHSFTGPPTGGSDLNRRLFSLSNNGRTVLWRAAWNEFATQPILGGGAGSFQRWWYAHRTSAYEVQDAHNLYVQMLGELGVLGGGLLALFLGVPLVAAVRARRHPLTAATLGAYVAYLAHCIVDWDWQMPAVTLLALAAGALLLVAARGEHSRTAKPLGTGGRRLVVASAGAAGVVAFVGLVGNIALAKSEDAIPNGNGKVALAQAEKAHRWAPWSAEALRELGDAEILTGDREHGLAHLRRAAAIDPDDWQTWFDIASATAGRERERAIVHVEALNPYASETRLLQNPPSLPSATR